MHDATFVRRGRRVAVPCDGTVLEAGKRAGLPLASSCRGAGICDACVVVVVLGAESLSAPTAKEVAAGLPSGERLSCQVRLVGGPATFTTTYW